MKTIENMRAFIVVDPCSVLKVGMSSSNLFTVSFSVPTFLLRFGVPPSCDPRIAMLRIWFKFQSRASVVFQCHAYNRIAFDCDLHKFKNLQFA